MQVAKKTRYGLQILMQLGEVPDPNQLVNGRDIALRQDINEPYVEQLLTPLRQAGLVRTVRGRHGGYALGRQAQQISVLDVIETFEGEVDLAADDEMLSGASHEAWDEVSRAVRNAAESITLAEVLAAQRGKMPEYVI